MSQWWKLPPELGGGIGEERANDGHWVTLYIPGRPYHIKIVKGELTKSPPPCPPEPDREMTLVDSRGRAWQNLDIGTWKCVDGLIRKWQDLWERNGPISVLGPPMPLVIEQTTDEELWPWKQVKWADVTETARQTVWTGSTFGNLSEVKVSKAYAIGGRKKDNRRVNIQVHFPGYKPQFLSFTTDVAQELAEALMYASGDD